MPQTQSLVSVLTPRGRGAVASIAFAGDIGLLDDANVFHAANGKRLAGQSLNRIAFGRWGDEPAEEVVICRIGTDRLEIHCHGGDAAAARIVSQVAEAGAKLVAWLDFVEWTEGRFARDNAASLANAATMRTASIIGQQYAGPLREFVGWLLKVDPAAQQREILDRIDAALRWTEFGQHLTEPWRVVLYGAPNVGKSSLINALAGFERAIVFDRPGTTRDVVTAETAFAGWPVRLSDTAGIRISHDEIEIAGIAKAKRELAEADLRICVCDGSDASSFDVLHVAEIIPSLVVINKCDLPGIAAHDAPPDGLFVSARTKAGIADLMSRITQRLVPRLPASNEAIPVTARQMTVFAEAREHIAARDFDAFRRCIAALGPMPETIV